MPDFANHGTAAGLDDLAEIVGHLMTKSVVGNQQEPALAALGDDGTGCADRLRMNLVRQLRRRRPKGGQRSLREISAELAQRGIMNERGQPFSAASINSMLESRSLLARKI
jgi:hypothetical protein